MKRRVLPQVYLENTGFYLPAVADLAAAVL